MENGLQEILVLFPRDAKDIFEWKLMTGPLIHVYLFLCEEMVSTEIKPCLCSPCVKNQPPVAPPNKTLPFCETDPWGTPCIITASLGCGRQPNELNHTEQDQVSIAFPVCELTPCHAHPIGHDTRPVVAKSLNKKQWIEKLFDIFVELFYHLPYQHS